LGYFQFFWENRQITYGINFVAVGVCFDRREEGKKGRIFTTKHTKQHEKGERAGIDYQWKKREKWEIFVVDNFIRLL
jgi:hypothetical protein